MNGDEAFVVACAVWGTLIIVAAFVALLFARAKIERRKRWCCNGSTIGGFNMEAGKYISHCYDCGKLLP